MEDIKNFKDFFNESLDTNKLNDDAEFNSKIKGAVKYDMNKYDVDANTVWSSLGKLIKYYGG